MKRIASAIALAFILSSGAWWIAKACGPDFVVAVFSFRKHPDFPRTAFVDGKLGVILPTYARSYWVIAYRYLTGIGLDAGEKEQVRDYFGDRAGGPTWKSRADLSGDDWFARWREARERIANPPAPKVSPVTKGQMRYDPETHAFYLNCAPDAFRIALRTMEERRARFGQNSAAFRSWLAAQDIVFGDCVAEKPSIPPDADANLPVLIRQDREYQIAAAKFYSDDYAGALAGFKRIAADASSPWNMLASYLVARTMLRFEKTDDLRPAALAILANPHLQPIQGMTLNLVYRADIRARDQDLFRSLARLLASRHQEDGLREELWDYTDLYDNIIGRYDPNDPSAYVDPNNPPKPLDKARFRDADLTDFIFTVQSRDADDAARAIAKWRATKSKQWLIASLVRGNAEQARRDALIEASNEFGPDSPGYLIAAYHRNRLRIDLGEKDAAREEIDSIFTSGGLKGLPSSVNLFRSLRMQAAPDFHDFVAFALRKPVLLTTDDDEGQFPAEPENEWSRKLLAKFNPGEERLDGDSTAVLNYQTPFADLKQMAFDESLPADLHRELLLTVFTRGLMLNDDLTDIAKLLGADPDRFAAAFFILHHPETRPYLASGIPRQTAPGHIDDFRDNWWCPMDLPVRLDSRANMGVAMQRIAVALPQPNPAAEELRVLERSGNATEFLGSIVLAYARSHPEDTRVPEALHLIVESGHFGCQDTDTWKTTRAAFRELHTRYPHSSWTAKTKSWYRDVSIREQIWPRDGKM